MKKNLMKEKLSKGEVVTGVMIQEPTTQITEILGLLGFDWLLIDCEHSPMTTESVVKLVMAAELRGLTPLVRIPQNVPEIILRYMDLGALGIMVPNMASLEEANKAVRGVKYPPEGERGLAGTRVADFGMKEPLGEYVKNANLETMILGLIESREGVEHVEEILRTEGVDGVFIGTNDLSKSLGVPGETSHSLVLNAIDKVLGAGAKTGKPIGAAVRGGETPKTYIQKGYRIISTTVTGLVAAAGKQFIENARG